MGDSKRRQDLHENVVTRSPYWIKEIRTGIEIATKDPA
jgi:hypothetical protein